MSSEKNIPMGKSFFQQEKSYSPIQKTCQQINPALADIPKGITYICKHGNKKNSKIYSRQSPAGHK